MNRPVQINYFILIVAEFFTVRIIVVQSKGLPD